MGKHSHDCLHYTLKTDSSTTSKNIILLHGLNDKDTVSNNHCIWFSTYIYNTTQYRPTYDLTVLSALLLIYNFSTPTLFHITLSQNHNLKGEENIPGILEVNPFGFSLAVICLRRSFTAINCWVVTALRLMLNYSLKTVDLFASYLERIICYACCFICCF